MTERKLDDSTHGGRATRRQVALCSLVRENSRVWTLGAAVCADGETEAQNGWGGVALTPGLRAAVVPGPKWGPPCSVGLQAQIRGCPTHGTWLIASPQIG